MKKNSVIVPDDSNLIHIVAQSPMVGRDQWSQPATSQREKRQRQQQRTEELRQQNEERRRSQEESDARQERQEEMNASDIGVYARKLCDTINNYISSIGDPEGFPAWSYDSSSLKKKIDENTNYVIFRGDEGDILKDYKDREVIFIIEGPTIKLENFGISVNGQKEYFFQDDPDEMGQSWMEFRVSFAEFPVTLFPVPA